MDNITPNATNRQNGINQPIGCSTICVNEPDHVSSLKFSIIFFSQKFVTICLEVLVYKNQLKMYETVITLVTNRKEFLWFFFINSKMQFYFIFVGNFSSYRGCSSRGSQSFLHCFGSYHRIESTRKASSECWFRCYYLLINWRTNKWILLFFMHEIGFRGKIHVIMLRRSFTWLYNGL